ncbi:hypothetical protein BpHYR1_049869 [Brachionus plicatilis]|uniref:RNA-directed DNA polymerase from mobile element jockey-like n=1 Tax=Brachionus plicatilis TaxID=10195 RepID=A0A3M7PVD1_BRAPC|nr:hypothetical protein BpHYR1_049869 [Brachionus plicatilis]
MIQFKTNLYFSFPQLFRGKEESRNKMRTKSVLRKSLNELEHIEWYQRPYLKSSVIQDVPAASTRGNKRRVKSQSFTSREINDFHSSVSARMHFFTNRVSTMWNQLPDIKVNASSLNIFKARLDFWLREEENRKKLG